MGKIAIFIPVYNEAETLGEILKQIPPKILSYSTEIVVVDDKSGDNSAEIAKKFTPHVIESNKNGGVGMATRKGFEYIAKKGGYRFVIKLDGDGQHSLHFLPQVAANLEKGADVVICSRFHPLSDQSYTPIDRILLNMIFTEIIKKITGWSITDARSGYMGFQFGDIKKIAGDIIIPRYGVPMEILLRIWNIKPDARIYEIPHPAVYGGLSQKLQRKYSIEKIGDKGSRLQIAYAALLAVVEDLKIPREKILGINGLKC
ncbi:MAG: hypothetical protein A3A94_02495 [Candidatus Portnoybacteria bacterium RIFCSPLOWO2_01_FULL_43_11]|uniref:Glycosyltransferase 2-like domain-containing protein n=3 Tax=Candidatus Portnoyibacteriota TaxID=1817913 RepID=A0A1G2FB67_9BACT|nr:MAG: hypothetical protein A2815_02350 [Candidatus Portnoybacteria bacterium RIFCSPHIGHO2_01_FULL_40_12b]OGZ38878.1 MAG: hypothetical protein A3A94_02495 [Candidatus Portnoybacteria bacterium RIFCSPLOWO2_01_FULL_43_11]OGZ40508.1 MAG: hypothetical protein A3I20_00465 [Candidatus Portnoybacteria bacterium RIFCSPLOWO2_02_FULL_40_15]